MILAASSNPSSIRFGPWVLAATILGYFFKGFGGVLLVGSILVFVSWKPLGEPPALANLVGCHGYKLGSWLI